MPKKRYAIVSYNMYGNFTNYGSALQTYALHNVINNLAPNEIESIVLDYCPDVLKDKDILNPMKNMWDTDDESRRMCELSMPAIIKNNSEFQRFYSNQYALSSKKYDSTNFNESLEAENIDGYVCGSDTIFCIDEFGFDDGYYANYPCMKNGYSVSYAASFGDAHFDNEGYQTLNDRLKNFKALAIRENDMIPYVKEHVSCPVKKVVDPTLLLPSEYYERITWPRQTEEKYILLYARRYNKAMEKYAEVLSNKIGCKIIEISLRATNSEMHQMRYEAGVEEFLSLVKHAEMVITNSFHGMIFAVQFKRPFYIFSREQCNTKITEILDMFGIKGRLLVTGEEVEADDIDYELVHMNIERERESSMEFLYNVLVHNIK